MKNKLPIITSLVVVLIFVLLQVTVIIREGEVGVLTTLGKPVKDLNEPGRYFKWPLPIQKVHKLDNRLHTQETSFSECLTKGGKNIVVSVFAGWRVVEPRLFLERVGFSVEQAERNLDGLIRDRQKAVIGQYEFTQLFNTDASKVKLEEIEKEILAEVKAEARERYGVSIEVVGINRIGLPQAITESVFDRMRAERAKLANRYRAEGESKATTIRAEADAARDKLLASARADATRMRGEADAKAAEHYQVFAKNPELAKFLRRLESYEIIMKENATVVLGTGEEPFKVMDENPGAPKQP